MSDISKKTPKKWRNLNQVLYICYFILFQKNKDKNKIVILINFVTKVNIINLVIQPN